MRKGLILTLMMFATVMVCMPKKSFAIAPTVNDIPNVVVGDAEDKATLDNLFVFPDALNLDSYIVDPDTPYSGIAWSYTTTDPANPRYRINGVYPLDLITDDPTSPPVGKRIDNQVLLGERNPDGVARTITIRDWLLSPIGGPTVDPGSAGVVNPAGDTITLFGSDGYNYDQKDILVYTDNEGVDRYAGDFIPAAPITTIYFGNGVAGFTSTPPAGTVTYSSTGAICVEVPGPGTNIGAWVSADQFIPLVADSVWRVRLTVTSNQTTVGDVPLWDVVIDNFRADISGPNGYGGDYIFLDNVGGAEAAGPIGRTDFQVWYAPPAFQTPQWDPVVNDPAVDPYNDMRVQYRVLDVDAAGINSAADFGTICVSRLSVDRFDIGDMTVGDMVYPANVGLNHITPATWTVGDVLASTAVLFNVDNTVTIRPINPVLGWLDSIIDINPGDNFANIFTGEGVADNWPIPWEGDTLYMVTSNWSAPDATSATNPPDVIRIGMDSPQTELSGMSITTPGLWDFATQTHYGMPNTTPAAFNAFFFSHSVSRSTTPNCLGLRPRMDILNASTLVLGGVIQNTGAVKVHDCKVEKVTFDVNP